MTDQELLDHVAAKHGLIAGEKARQSPDFAESIRIMHREMHDRGLVVAHMHTREDPM